jgi:ring-1,2-phenylacetyl-CoA epoxidase subunit PaaD
VLTEQAILSALADVLDPEIPVLSVVELGVIRAISIDGDRVTVDMTPTFAGCPALAVMRAQVAERVRRLGAAQVEVHLVLSPPWTTDWISDDARARLRAYGLAPAPRLAGAPGGLLQIQFDQPAVCPHCGSTRTELKNAFGPTLCRALYYCHNCQQPFEQFKAL